MTRTAYTLLIYLLLPFTPIKLLWRGRKQPEYRQHWAERYGFYSFTMQKPVIWLHCVSVGETRAAAPLVKALLLNYPHHQILLTHSTPTGRAASESIFGDGLYGNRVAKAYLPFDAPFAVKNFLTHFKPVLGVLMETELWFNLIAGCQQEGVPLLLVNARLSEKSALGYAKLGQLVRAGLQSLTAIAAQTEADAKRLQYLSGRKPIHITVTGNLKFDMQVPPSTFAHGQQLRELFDKERLVFMAASTREGEEIMILNAVAAISCHEFLTVIVPRHPQRFNEVEALLQQRSLPYQKRSDLKQPLLASTRYVLGDSMGELFDYYAACDIALVGGSLQPFGGQNLIEAAMLGKPVLVGVHTYNFMDATNEAIAAGAVIQVKNVADLQQKITLLLDNSSLRAQMGAAGLQFSQAATGATAKIMKLINAFLMA